MKRTLAILAITIGFILALSGIYAGLAALGIHLGLTGRAVPIVSALIQDIPLLALFVWLNQRFYKQKILFSKYNLLKAFGILWMAWLYLALSVHTTLTQYLSALTVLGTLLAMAVVGMTEEFIFRGLILGTLVSKGKSLPFAVTVSSVAFGLTHVVNLGHQSLYDTALQMIYVIALGVLLATLYLKSNNRKL